MNYQDHITEFSQDLDSKPTDLLVHASKVARSHMSRVKASSNDYKILKLFSDKLMRLVKSRRKPTTDEGLSEEYPSSSANADSSDPKD